MTDAERRLFQASPPFGILLFARNMESAPQTAELISQIRALSDPPPLLYVDQEGGTVDRIGPILGPSFPSAALCAEKGTDRVHECAYLMGRAARLLGFDVDFAPCVDLGQPNAGGLVLAGRTFGFHAEDVILAGMVFLHGLARAGVSSCLKHFPGLGRGKVDSHDARPVIDAHDVDLLVTDVAPFTKLHRSADGVMVTHAAYPKFTEDETPASMSPRIIEILRRHVGFDGVVYSDDLAMNALEGTIPERARIAAEAGCDVVCLGKPFESYEEALARVAEVTTDDPARRPRLAALRRRSSSAPRPPFDVATWEALAGETERFLEELARPRKKRDDFSDVAG